MATKAVYGVVDAIADAFSPRPRQPRVPDDMIRELESVRRVTSYHRDRFLKDACRRNRTVPSERDVEMAVLEALHREKAGE
jgi:hypothetical protein